MRSERLGCDVICVDGGWRSATWESEPLVGGSDVSALLNIAPWKGATLWSRWAQLHGETPTRRSEDNAVLRRGQVCEPVVLAEYGRIMNARVIPVPQFVVVDPAEPWRVGSLDALSMIDGVAGIVDGKTDMRPEPDDRWGKHGTVVTSWYDGADRLIPPHIATQGYWYMSIAANAPWCDFAVAVTTRRYDPILDGAVAALLASHTRALQLEVLNRWDAARKAVTFENPIEVRVIRLMRDDATQQRLVDEVRRLRQTHLIDGVRPAVDSSDDCSRELRAKFRKSGPMTRATPELAELVRRYRDLSLQLKQAEAERALVLNTLRDALGESSGVVLDPEVGRRPVKFKFKSDGNPVLTGGT